MNKKPYTVGFGKGNAGHKARARGARPTGQMNKTETRYAEHLEVQRLAGEIVSWQYEPLKLRLGENWKTTFTADFMVVRASGEVELVDVKGSGGAEDDARVKIKTAARLYPQFWFVEEMWKAKQWHRWVVSRDSDG